MRIVLEWVTGAGVLMALLPILVLSNCYMIERIKYNSYPQEKPFDIKFATDCSKEVFSEYREILVEILPD